jgi:hypothetical protein
MGETLLVDKPPPPDPALAPGRAARLQRRLIGATFARAGFRDARSLCETLVEAGRYADHKTDWLAIAVLYARPFTQNEVGRLSSTSFEAFDSEELDAVHRLLVSARHNTFAHTGVHPALSAVVLPPGAWSERGSTTVGEVPFASELLPQIIELCDTQIERCDCWIEELVQALYGYQRWPEGMMFILDWPGKSYEPQLPREDGAQAADW